jgi:uncharacterized lipoprotein
MTLPKSLLGSTLLLLVAAVTLTTGCASSRRETYLRDKASTHVYRQPLAEVWPKAQELLTEEGYSLMQTKTGFEMTTDFMMQGAPSSLGTSYARYLVRGIEKGPGQCTVEFLKQARLESRAAPGNPGAATEPPTSDSTSTARDSEMEWKLIQKADPEAAKALEAEATQTVQ